MIKKYLAFAAMLRLSEMGSAFANFTKFPNTMVSPYVLCVYCEQNKSTVTQVGVAHWLIHLVKQSGSVASLM